MAISKYTLYKYVKVDGTWRYCKAAYHDNGKIKPDIVFEKLVAEFGMLRSAVIRLVEGHPSQSSKTLTHELVRRGSAPRFITRPLLGLGPRA